MVPLLSYITWYNNCSFQHQHWETQQLVTLFGGKQATFKINMFRAIAIEDQQLASSN